VNPEHTDPLIPQLHEAELKLDDALGEACEIRPSSKADTGDLIRLDELLASAADATKRAISLRRRRRADGSQRVDRATVIGDVEAAASPLAMHRVVVDGRGVQWDVFAVHPEARFAVPTKLRGTFPAGWLCFDSGAEKRRLSPIPGDWQTMADRQLADLAGQAEAASSRRSRPRTEPGPDDGNRQ
jgi:hypothetical protein